MININKSFDVTGAAGATYSFSSSGNIIFTPQQGTVSSTGRINVVLQYEDIDDFSFPVELKIVSNENCVETYTFIETSPCNNLTATISKSDLTFTANVSGGNPSYKYNWSYDTTVFKQTVTNTSVLTLQLKAGVTYPPSSSLTLTVTDNNGCEVQYNYPFSIEGPSIQNQSLSTVCFDSPSTTICGYQVTQWATFLFDTSLDLDFDNAQLTYDEDKICLIKIPNGYNAQIVDTTDTQVITGKIPNSKGILSNEFTITILTKSCVNQKNEVVAETRVFPDSDFTTGISIDDFTWNADKDCFEFIASNGQTLIGPHELTGKRGTYTYVNGTIFYVDGVGTDDQEIIRYKVCSDIDENKKTTGTLINTFEKLPAPVLTNGWVCTTCEQTLSNISIEPLISGDYDLSTVEIATPAVNTTVTVNANGTLNFTQNNTFDPDDVVGITVKNSDGIISNEANIEIKRVCQGNVSNVVKNITCSSKTFNLLDVLSAASSTYVGGSTWSETTSGSNTYTDQSGTITGNVGAVDFTGIDAGTYTFKASTGTLTCSPTGGQTLLSGSTYSSQSTVTIIMGIEETITITSVISTPIGTNDEINIFYTVTDFTSLVDFKVLINGIEASVHFNQINSILGTGIAKTTVTSTGTYTVAVQMRTKCNNIISDTDSIVIS